MPPVAFSHLLLECDVSFRKFLEKSHARWSEATEDIAHTCFARKPFPLYQLFDVSGILDLLPAVERSLMPGDFFLSIEDADGVEIRKDDKRLAGMRVRDGVIIEIESHVGSLPDVDFFPLLGGEGIVRERAQGGAIPNECIANRHALIFDPASF